MKQLIQITGSKLLHEMHPHRDKYPDMFFYWLQFNEHIWLQFEKHGLTMARKRERYSARTIIEVMRWQSDIMETAPRAKPLFKLSNNMTPGLARMWMAKHGARFPKFFSLHKEGQ